MAKFDDWQDIDSSFHDSSSASFCGGDTDSTSDDEHSQGVEDERIGLPLMVDKQCKSLYAASEQMPNPRKDPLVKSQDARKPRKERFELGTASDHVPRCPRIFSDDTDTDEGLDTATEHRKDQRPPPAKESQQQIH
jgi:hypothetical protein